jgi:rfaE bifunctional protein kinase chain/domain
MEKLFSKYKNLTIAVFGDYYLDDYFWIDAALNEPSLETGLVAYQCVKQESFPGASGTIAKNLANLGIGTVYAVGFTGDDGRGMELRQGLDKLGINQKHMLTVRNRITPTHTKPWLNENGQTRELNRIDIKNWTPTPAELEDAALNQLKKIIKNIDALIILDHAVEENCGIITDGVRKALTQIAEENPELIIFADSRCRIGRFEGMLLKGNQYELCHAVFGGKESNAKNNLVNLPADPSVERTDDEINRACEALREKTGKPVICTLGERGLRIYQNGPVIDIPGIAVSGELDVCGGGDMITSAFVSALAAGADMEEAGRIGNIAAAICVQQLGTSGNVTAGDILAAGKEN